MKKFLFSTVAASALATAMAPILASGGYAQETVAADDDIQFVRAYYGDINPFYGDISPFYGDINPFYGDISPFWGDIGPFWGTINPFYGDIAAFWGDISPFYGDIDPFWGDIGPFWGDIGPFWGDISAFWGDIGPFEAGTGDYVTLASQLEDMFARAESVFGPAIASETGADFRTGFLNDLLARYGFDPSDPASLEGVSIEQRSAFFIDFYDGLMNFSGMDHPDHWMPAVNWSPALAQSTYGGEGVLVGVLDFSFTSSENLNVRTAHGERDYLGINHGAAVAGLIGAPHDNVGVMGVAPGVTLNTYNPFDDTLSASWQDVSDGVLRLGQLQSDIINMSLGVPGWTLHQQWASVFSDHQIAVHARDTLFVIAAGNDGSTQTMDIDWTGVPTLDNLLIVGSVNPVGDISYFSNRPGDACLTVNGVCGEGQRLMDRFLVAPGEMILVSDGEGGVVRMSGTSFAAPLVAGAAALILGRWDWLEAGDVADILLETARDLGEPGTDAVYGRGMLDIGAAMLPIDAGNLFTLNGNNEKREVAQLGLIPGRLNFHSSSANAIYMFENINDTYRDFYVSMSSLKMDSGSAGTASDETYMNERTKTNGRATGFSDTGEYTRLVSSDGSLQVSAFASRSDPRRQIANGELPFQAGMRFVDTVSERELRFGAGQGAVALNSQEGFGLFSDHRPETGGVNPVLGFASGGAYAMTAMPMGQNTRLSVGVTSTYNERLFTNPFTGEQRPIFDSLSAYEAIAFLTDVSHDINDRLTVHASYTWLNEATGLLGAQGLGVLDMSGGAETDAVTLGAEAALPLQITLSSSATVARTRAAEFDGAFLALPDGAVSTAFQITARRDGVFGDSDAVRFSVIQPLHIEQGSLDYTATRVVDRATGAMAVETDNWALGGERPLFAEFLYATPLFGERADLSLFTRAQLAGDTVLQDVSGIASGMRFRVEF